MCTYVSQNQSYTQDKKFDNDSVHEYSYEVVVVRSFRDPQKILGNRVEKESAEDQHNKVLIC